MARRPAQPDPEAGKVYRLHYLPWYGPDGRPGMGHYTGGAVGLRADGSDGLSGRLNDHAQGRGANVTQVQIANGGTWAVADVMPGGHDTEVSKKHNASRDCSWCKTERKFPEDAASMTAEQFAAAHGLPAPVEISEDARLRAQAAVEARAEATRAAATEAWEAATEPELSPWPETEPVTATAPEPERRGGASAWGDAEIEAASARATIARREAAAAIAAQEAAAESAPFVPALPAPGAEYEMEPG